MQPPNNYDNTTAGERQAWTPTATPRGFPFTGKTEAPADGSGGPGGRTLEPSGAASPQIEQPGPTSPPSKIPLPASPFTGWSGSVDWLSLRVPLCPPSVPWFINGSISREKPAKEALRGGLQPRDGQSEPGSFTHPEDTTAWAVITVNPAGLGVKRQDKVTVRKPSGGDRGEISGLSDKARRRLMQHLMRVDLRAVASPVKNPLKARALFVTLTYPATYPDCEEAKRHLSNLRRRLDWHHPYTWAVWIQEFQQRGAPHFHLVLVLDEVVSMADFRRWIAQAWYEVAESEDERHLQAGTSTVAVYVEPEGLGNLMGYLSGYLGGHGKEEQQTAPLGDDGEPVPTGRMWGFWRKKNVPFEQIAVIVVKTPEAWDEFKRRVAQHYEKSPYLSRVDRYNWTGGLLFGEGLELTNKLLQGIEGIELREVL